MPPVAATQHLKIVKKDNTVHIVPDNKMNREFHARYTTQAQPGDKYKSLSIVKGKYLTDKEDGEVQFDETSHVETLFENNTPEDSRAAALTAENDALQAQIDALQRQLKESKASDAV
jgi:hypothetical protein